MIFDMNITLKGIDENFLEDLEELIEDTRVEYFIINLKNQDKIKETQELCKKYLRFKYTLPIIFKEDKDKNCVAIQVEKISDLESIDNLPIVIESENLNEEFISFLNNKDIKGVVLNAQEKDNKLENFVFSISYDSVKSWNQLVIKNCDYNKLAIQSNYPKYNYDELLNLLKDISDLTFRAEQSIASGSTRTLLKMFSLL